MSTDRCQYPSFHAPAPGPRWLSAAMGSLFYREVRIVELDQLAAVGAKRGPIRLQVGVSMRDGPEQRGQRSGQGTRLGFKPPTARLCDFAGINQNVECGVGVLLDRVAVVQVPPEHDNEAAWVFSGEIEVGETETSEASNWILDMGLTLCVEWKGSYAGLPSDGAVHP